MAIQWKDPDNPNEWSVFGGGLGLDPVTVQSTIEGVQKAKSFWEGLTKNKRDPDRLAANAAAYQLALQGFENALLYLKYRSGRHGIATFIGDPINEGPIGGWATPEAKDDANKLYNAALAATGVRPEEVGDSGTSTGQPSGTKVNGQPQGLPRVTTMAAMSYTPLLLLGAIALAFGGGRKRA